MNILILSARRPYEETAPNRERSLFLYMAAFSGLYTNICLIRY